MELEATPLAEIDHFEYPETGGMFVFYKGFKYPKRGFPYWGAIWAINFSKRIIISTVRLIVSPALLPAYFFFLFVPKKKIIKRFMELFDDCLDVIDALYYMPRADYKGKPFYLTTQRFSSVAKELARYVMLIFKNLGVEDATISKIGRIVCMIFEYDSAYTYRIQDIFNETNKKSLIKSPIKEVFRLYKIFSDREKLSTKVKTSFRQISLLLAVGMLVPKTRKAFINATKDINFEDIVPTEADKYHWLYLKGYDFLGKTYDERQETWRKIHNGTPPKHDLHVKVNV